MPLLIVLLAVPILYFGFPYIVRFFRDDPVRDGIYYGCWLASTALAGWIIYTIRLFYVEDTEYVPVLESEVESMFSAGSRFDDIFYGFLIFLVALFSIALYSFLRQRTWPKFLYIVSWQLPLLAALQLVLRVNEGQDAWEQLAPFGLLLAVGVILYLVQLRFTATMLGEFFRVHLCGLFYIETEMSNEELT